MRSVKETTNERSGGAGRRGRPKRTGLVQAGLSFREEDGAWSQILALPHVGYGTSGKYFNLSVPQFHHLSYGAIDSTYLPGCREHSLS